MSSRRRASNSLTPLIRPPSPPLKDELGLGPLLLPEGVDKKDVLWRRRAGLDTKQAVQAALMQARHDKAVGAKKAAKAKTAQVASPALLNLAELTVDKLKEHAATLKGFDLKGASRKDDIIAAINAYNESLAEEERAAS